MAVDDPIVVGVDGSAPSLNAASWAADEAVLRAPARLRVVLAPDDDLDDDRAARTVSGLATVLAASRPDLEISPEVRHGSPADVLVELSHHARLVVVGSRGRAPVAATLLGSVSAKVATHARCPAVVVRGYPRTGPVVVGLDGSPSSRDALEFAFEAAERHGTDLVAVHVWRDPEYAPVVPRLPYETADLRDAAHRSLAEQLAGWDERHPRVTVHRRAPGGHPVAELAASADGARLLVVGHRGHGGFAGLLLGSVARGAVLHAPSPVAVVRTGTSR
ncbi:universal stress protein [Saccharopolyspora rosea]|uniref:Universal stress protein n=1 Tax=Saccharopolyspora rosea TaxID=524884 RepID=A0ABW3FNB7_9PSEU|nr:universal stress protein [Saccharopolyspora rosea]